MNEYLSRLNPMERRFVVGVGVVVFIVLNLVFVWPHFSDWGDVTFRLNKAKGTLDKFDKEISRMDAYKKELRTLESQGASVPQENQAIEFLRNVQSQAALSHVRLLSNVAQNSPSTNQFFFEKVQAVTVQAGEKELVDFLYKLCAGESMIRVRDLSLHPDGTRQQLNASIRLVASYQKNTGRGARSATSTANRTATTTAR